MELGKRYFDVKYKVDWSYSTLDEIRGDLDAIEALGATHVSVDTEFSYGDWCVEIGVTSERVETTAECIERLEAAAKHKEYLSKLKELKRAYKEQ